MNLQPENEGPKDMPSDYYTTFGHHVHGIYLPMYFDPEGDDMSIIVRPPQKLLLNIYPVPYGVTIPSKDGPVQRMV